MIPEAPNRTQATPSFPVSQSTSQDSPLAQSPEAILDTWIGKLQFISLPAHPQVRNLLANVSQGLVSADNEAAAQWVFNLLVQYEEFEVFAEVFEAYNRIQTDMHTDPHTGACSFVSTLTLNLPREWRPGRTSAESLLATFERIQVDKLRVVAPDALTPVPAAMGPCIATLLESGKTTSLIVHGLLRPSFLDGTTIAKSALKSIELDGNAPPRILRLAFNELMGSLAKCTTLQHLILRHAEFAQFHTHIGQFESSLQSITLSGKTPDVDDTEGHAVDTDHIGAFVNVIAGIPTLSVLELKAAAVGPDSIFDHVFTSKLKGHPALTSLTIADWGRRNMGEDDKRTLVESNLFVRACPNLKLIEMSVDKAIPVAGPAVLEDEQMPPLEE